MAMELNRMMASANRHTAHSSKRSAQRGFSEFEIDLLLQYGSEELQNSGRRIVFYSKRDFARLSRDLRRAHDKLQNLQKMYAVEASDGQLITVGHRYRHLRRQS